MGNILDIGIYKMEEEMHVTTEIFRVSLFEGKSTFPK